MTAPELHEEWRRVRERIDSLWYLAFPLQIRRRPKAMRARRKVA